VVTISTNKLIENPETKKIYGSSDDSTLKLSISLLGVLEPLIVFQVGDSLQLVTMSNEESYLVITLENIGHIMTFIILLKERKVQNQKRQ